MKKEFLLLLFVSIFLFSFASSQTTVDYFYGIGCPHCAKVESSGIIEKVNLTTPVTKNEVYYNMQNQNKFKELADFLNLKETERGIPFVFINCSGNYTYLIGDQPIINQLENAIANKCQMSTNRTEGFFAKIRENLQKSFNKNFSPTTGKLNFMGWIILIISALIDSINPCAFGVLIFLMISLLSLGSAKRAVRYGLIYSFVVFVTYFLAGLGILRVVQSLSAVRTIVYMIIGLFVLGFGLLEFADYFRASKKKESILRISPRFKPLIERTIRKGTLPAMIILGILVSLFELPCTGGIYLAILSLLAQSSSISWLYLLVYNLIFVLPLIVLTLIIGQESSTEKLKKFNDSEKKWMKLAAGILLIILSLVIFLGI